MTTTIVLLDTADHDTVGRVEASGSNKGERTERDVKRAHPSLGGGSGVSSLEVLELDSCSTPRTVRLIGLLKVIFIVRLLVRSSWGVVRIVYR